MHSEDYMRFLYGMLIGLAIIVSSTLAGCDYGVKRYQKELYPELCPECQQKLMKQIVENL